VTFILILSGNVMIFILSLIGAQACRAQAKWRWMWVSIACVFLSGGCIAGELYQAFAPGAARDILSGFQNTSPM
jgi:hypothetical protein